MYNIVKDRLQGHWKVNIDVLSISISVDCVANVFTQLKHDLRDELIKELFVYYNGCTVLLSYFKPTSKVSHFY